jgi:hypothetical protein
MQTYWKIVRIPFVNNNWVPSSSTVLTSYYDPMFSDSIGDGKDSFQFKMNNFNGTLDNYFSIGDKILLSYKVNSASIESSDLLCTGVVKNLPETNDNTQNLLRIEGNNFSETLMNAIVFADGNGLPINQVIKNALSSINAMSPNYPITFDDTTIASSTTQGTTFPTVQEQWFYKTAWSLLEKYSQNEYTGDGNYYYYIDANNVFYWKPRLSDTTYSFSTETSAFRSINIKRDLKNVVNFVINKGGRSPGGRILSKRAQDNVSIGKTGFHFKLLTNGKHKDQTVGQDQRHHGNKESEFPPDADFPYTTVWKDSVTNDYVVCADKDAYDDAVVTEVEYRLKREAQLYIDLHKDGKLQVELELEPTTFWLLGSVVNVTIPKIGKNNYPMRVEARQFTSDSITYTLIEDEASTQ